jgi:hypothetical protein
MRHSPRGGGRDPLANAARAVCELIQDGRAVTGARYSGISVRELEDD